MHHDSYDSSKNKWTVFLPVKPTPKGRPRFANGIVYTPAGTTKAEKEIKTLLTQFCVMKLKGELGIRLSFNIEKPRTSRLDYPHWANDIDNLSKLVMDSLNGIAYEDDSHVTVLLAEKQWGNPQGIYLTLWEIS